MDQLLEPEKGSLVYHTLRHAPGWDYAFVFFGSWTIGLVFGRLTAWLMLVLYFLILVPAARDKLLGSSPESSQGREPLLVGSFPPANL